MSQSDLFSSAEAMDKFVFTDPDFLKVMDAFNAMELLGWLSRSFVAQ